ncbi:MAG TPA: HD domain-containing phosphohydrolase [Rhodocyclaceae bacterium]|nr:HD domain-containing phosphohydrolase [Rhodocyclaceae bacterium]
MTQHHKDSLPCLLLVDDEPANLQLLRQILQHEYRLLFAVDGASAIALARTQQPDLVLLDVMMPGMTGYEVCCALKADAATAHIPVIFVTALADTGDELEGFNAGAVDYVTKPLSPPIVRVRVRNQLSLEHMQELRDTGLQIIERLGIAAEYKDNETGQHVIRMSQIARHLALAAGASEKFGDDLLHAAHLHDIGKIGIPDGILLKPGKLDANEWEIMKTHATVGAHIIGEHHSGILAMARSIALTHHEKWDGSGYPAGLAGEAIPLEGRIAAIADVFDALTSERPYKRAWPVEEAVAHMREQAGRHFDPQLIDIFLGELPALIALSKRWQEPATLPEPACVS